VYPLPVILNEHLTEKTIPWPDAEWDEIALFALTFNGYPHMERVNSDSGVPELLRDGTLSELRAWLFAMQRMYRHMQSFPEGEELAAVHQVVERMRAKVASGEIT
jgi:hypothetical protein